MYLDFYKFNYDLIPEKERAKYIKRDKDAYASLVHKWIFDNNKDIVSRKWQIDDVFFLKEDTDFANLLREAEKLYEFGFFTSCIALTCIIAEDFTKFIAIKTGNTNWVPLKQFRRLQELLSNNIITQDNYDKLDDIRELRNSLLHFDGDFKAKSVDETQNDALRILNVIKEIISNHIGARVSEISSENFGKILGKITKGLKEEEVASSEEIQYRLRNAVGQLFNLSLVFDPNEKVHTRESVFMILDIDFNLNDVDLLDLGSRMPVCVDLNKHFRIKFENLLKGDFVQATITSKIDKFGQTSIFKFQSIRPFKM